MSEPNIDQSEVAKFSQLSAQWWDPQGELKTLHDINPLRLQYINENAALHGKQILDIGCGGGLLSEGMAKLGAKVTGIDMSESALTVAKLHQTESATNVEYILSTAEAFALTRPNQFDVITCLEMLEHVPDPCSIIQAAAKLVKPDGHLFFSTLNRNAKSYLFTIIGAEYLFKLLPKNTHDFAKFIRPSELAEWARKANLNIEDMTGMSYNIFTRESYLCPDISVNYLIYLRPFQR